MIELEKILTLKKWIGFIQAYGKTLDERQSFLSEYPDTPNKNWLIAEFNLERLYALTAYFHNMSRESAEKIFTIRQVNEFNQNYYQGFFDVETPIALQPSYDFLGEKWTLPPEDLLPGNKMTFGEFIDAKIIVQNAQQRELSKWEMLHEIAVIFFRKEREAYDEHFLEPEFGRAELLLDLPIPIVLHIAEWFERFNNYVMEYFPVFHPSASANKSGLDMKRHYDQFGWINFLKSIAKTKAFDVPTWGLNSIDCVRRSLCFDVLMWASEEKSLNDAMQAEYEANK